MAETKKKLGTIPFASMPRRRDLAVQRNLTKSSNRVLNFQRGVEAINIESRHIARVNGRQGVGRRKNDPEEDGQGKRDDCEQGVCLAKG